MKKPLKGWRAVLLVAAVLAAFFAAAFGCGRLLSKAQWLPELKGWERRFHLGWWVFFGVHLILYPPRLKEKHPRLARIGSICVVIALIFLAFEGALRHAFDLTGI